MPIKRNLTGKQLGSKVRELFYLMETTTDWERYVASKTKLVIETLYKHKTMLETLEELNMKYPTARAHILKAIDRIKNKKVDYLRGGESELAQRLFELLDIIDNWENLLTDHEVLLANKFRELKNFYAVGRELDLIPSNIAATLYGSAQKLGVMGKLEKYIRQGKLKKSS